VGYGQSRLIPLERTGVNVTKSHLPDSLANKLLLQLLAIPGGSGNEGQVVEFLRKQLLAANALVGSLKTDNAHRRSLLDGEAGNLVLRLPGTVKGPRRLLSAHMDTVPICVGTRPVRRGGRIVSGKRGHGLGGDDRAGVAVLLSTALAILKQRLPHPPLTFLWTVQEEAGLHGARHVQLSLLGKPRLAFNFDGGSASRLTLGATGGYRLAIEIQGRASHAGAHPEEGVSAIAIAALATADLVEHGWHGLVEKGGQRGTSNIGVIAGGAATNVVCDLVRIRAEARGHDRKFRERIVREIERAFQRAAKQVRASDGAHGRVKIEGRLDYEAFSLPRSEPSVAAAAAAIEAEGFEVDYAIANGGLDANWLTAHGIPTVSLGCGQNNIHTVEEWLDLKEFHLARRIALRLATGA
jgi:tripeptide aminopeptidase